MNLSIVPPRPRMMSETSWKHSFSSATTSVASMPSERRVNCADVDEQDRHLALDAACFSCGVALEQLVQHVVVDVAAERLLDALLLLERVAHLVEGARQLADLVARGRRHAHREVAGGEPLDADAQPAQRPDQQRHEADAREHADTTTTTATAASCCVLLATTGSTSRRRSSSTCASPISTSL